MLFMTIFSVTSDIINHVEDIRNTCNNFQEISIVYCSREYNIEVDKLINSVHKQLMQLTCIIDCFNEENLFCFTNIYINVIEKTFSFKGEKEILLPIKLHHQPNTLGWYFFLFSRKWPTVFLQTEASPAHSEGCHFYVKHL